VNLDSYHAWLAERGIEAPSCQPFVVLGSCVRQNATTWLVAAASAEDSATVEQACVKLSAALETLGQTVSWSVVDSNAGLPATQILKTMCPAVGNVFYLSGSYGEIQRDHQIEITQQRFDDDTETHRFPSIMNMNQNPDLKKKFWDYLKSKISAH
jgi:hypothetical protein